MAEIEFKATVSIVGNTKSRIISINKQDGSMTVYKKDKSKKIVNHTHTHSFIHFPFVHIHTPFIITIFHLLSLNTFVLFLHSRKQQT